MEIISLGKKTLGECETAEQVNMYHVSKRNSLQDVDWINGATAVSQ